MAVSIKFTPIKKDGTSDSTIITLTGSLLPTNVESQDNTTSISYNTVLGDFVDFPIALKRKVMMTWDILSDTQVDTLYYNGLLARVKANKRRFFKIDVLPTSGDTKAIELAKKIQSISANGIFYLGTPVSFKRIGENGGVTFYSGELHFIQVTGYTLNNPTTPNT